MIRYKPHDGITLQQIGDLLGREERLHNSNRKRIKLHPDKHKDNECIRELGKPIGFWYGIGEAWLEWQSECMSESFKESKYLHHVTLAPGTRILNIDSVGELHKLCKEYEEPWYIGNKVASILRRINWERVRETYDAIEFHNYNTVKFHSMGARFPGNIIPIWFYGIDCNSGCVWNTDKVTLDLIATVSLGVNHE